MFSLQAAVNLRLAQGAVSQVRSQIKSGLGDVSVNIKAKIDQGSISSLNSLAKNLMSVNSAVQQLNLSSLQAEKSVSRLASTSSNIKNVGAQASSGVKNLKSISLSYEEAGNAAEDFGRKTTLAGKRFIAFSAATTGIFLIASGFKNALDEAIKFDLEINKLRQVADEGNSAVNGLRDEILKLSTSLGVSSLELAKAATTITQAGIKATDATKAIKAFALALLAPNFDSAEQTVEGLIAVYQQFGKDASKLEEQLGSINAVAGAFAVEAGDLIKAVQKAGGAFKSAGGDLNELLALMTTVRSTTRESADQIATGLRSIFTYVQRTETIENLKNLGIELRYTANEAKALGNVNLENQFVGPYQAVMRLSKGLAQLRTTDPRYSQIVEDLGGVRQVSRVLPLIRETAEAQKALNIARLGSASLEAAAAIRQDAIATKMTKVTEAYQKLANNLVQSKGFTILIDNLSTIAIKLAGVVEAAAPLIPVLGALAAIKIATNLGAFTAGALTPHAYSAPKVKKYAGGGGVQGKLGVDKIPAMLTHGEYVVNARDAQKNMPLLQMINSGKQVQFFSGGGSALERGAALPDDKSNGGLTLRAVFFDALGKMTEKALRDKKLSSLMGDGGEDTIASAVLNQLQSHTGELSDFQPDYPSIQNNVLRLKKSKKRRLTVSESAGEEGATLFDEAVKVHDVSEGFASKVEKFLEGYNASPEQISEIESLLERVKSGDNKGGSATKKLQKIKEQLQAQTSTTQPTEPTPSEPKPSEPPKVAPKPKTPKPPKKAPLPEVVSPKPVEIPFQPGASFAGSTGGNAFVLPPLNPKQSPIDAGPAAFLLDNPGIKEARANQLNNDPSFAVRPNPRKAAPLATITPNAETVYSDGSTSQGIKSALANQSIFDQAKVVNEPLTYNNNLNALEKQKTLALSSSGGQSPPRLPPAPSAAPPPEDLPQGTPFGFGGSSGSSANNNFGFNPSDGKVTAQNEADKAEKDKLANRQKFINAFQQRLNNSQKLTPQDYSRGANDEDLLDIRKQLRENGIGIQEEAKIPGTPAYLSKQRNQQVIKDKIDAKKQAAENDVVQKNKLAAANDLKKRTEGLDKGVNDYYEADINATLNPILEAARKEKEDKYQREQIRKEYEKRKQNKRSGPDRDLTSTDPLARRAALRNIGVGLEFERDFQGSPIDETKKKFDELARQKQEARKKKEEEDYQKSEIKKAYDQRKAATKKYDPKTPDPYSSDPLERRQALRNKGVDFAGEVAAGLNPNFNAIKQAEAAVSMIPLGVREGTNMPVEDPYAIMGRKTRKKFKNDAAQRYYDSTTNASNFVGPNLPPQPIKPAVANNVPTVGKNQLGEKVEIPAVQKSAQSVASLNNASKEFERIRKGIEDYGIANEDLTTEIYDSLQKGIINTRQAQQLINEANNQRNPKRTDEVKVRQINKDFSEGKITAEKRDELISKAKTTAEKEIERIRNNVKIGATSSRDGDELIQKIIAEEEERSNRDIKPVSKKVIEARAAKERQELRDSYRNPDDAQTKYVDQNAISDEERKRQKAAFEAFRRRETAKGAGLNLTNLKDSIERDTITDVQNYGSLGTSVPGFIVDLQQRKVEKAQEQLVRAIEAQIGALYKGIAAEDKKALAQELAASAILQGNQDVLRDKQGNLVGLASLGTELRDKGKSVDGQNRLSRFFNKFTGPDSGFLGRTAGKAGNYLANNGGTAAAIGLTTIAPYLSEAVGPKDTEEVDDKGNKRKVTAADRVVRGQTNESQFVAQTAGAATLSGAATGAAVGFAFGPWGAAVGAAAGAAIGLANSFSEAAKQINEAKLGNALSNLDNELLPIVNEKTKFSNINQNEVLSNIQTARSSALVKAYKESDSEFLGLGLNTDSYKENVKKQNRTSFGGQAQSIVTILSQQLTKLAKTTADDKTKTPAKLIEIFAADKLNKEFIRIVADVRGIPIKKVLEEFTQDLADAQDSVRVAKFIEDFNKDIDKTATSLARLSSAASNAGFASRKSLESGQINNLAFNQGSVPISSLEDAFNSLGGANSDAFNSSLKIIDQALGKGNGVTDIGKATDILSKNLPSILGQLAGQNIDFNDTTDVTVRKALLKTFEGSGVDAESPAATKAINSVLAGIKKADKEEKGNALKAIDTDASKFAEDLLRPLVEPFKTEGVKIAKELADNAGRFVDGLSQYYRNVETINSGLNNLSELNLNSSRVNAVSRSDALGGGDPNRFISVKQLLEPFNNKQGKLLDGTGLDNTDVEGITNRLNEKRGQLEAARVVRDNSIGDKNKFPETARNFEKLNNEANNLQQALKNLADPAQRAAAIQEKLNQLNQDKDNRLSYAEKFINANPEERARLNRGQRLVDRLKDKPEDFKNLTDDDKRLALEAARNIGGSKFANGKTGEGLRNQFLETTGILNPDDENQRKDLLNQQKQVAGDAVKAQEGLVGILQDQNQKFFDNLNKSQDVFFNRLEANIIKEAAVRQQQKINENQTQGGKLKQQTDDASFLSKLGVKNQEDLNIARGQVKNINDLGIAESSQIKFDKESIRNELGKGNAKYFQRTGAISGLSEEERLASARELINETSIKDKLNVDQKAALAVRIKDFNKNSDFQGSTLEQKDEFGTNLITQVISDYLGDLNKKNAPSDVISKINKSSVLKGEEVQKLKPEDRKRLTDILDSGFKNSGESLDNLTIRIKTNGDAFKVLSDELTKLNAKIAEINARVPVGTPTVNKAKGGVINPIFSPKGTDVVPAMLSRGEYVVNADATAKHRDLLESINSGTSYFSQGGIVGSTLASVAGKAKKKAVKQVALVNAIKNMDRFGEFGLNSSYDAIKKKADKKFGAYGRLDEAGKIKSDEYAAKKLLKINSNRQLGSLLEQQTYASTEDEQYSEAISRIGAKEEANFSIFKQRFGSGFVNLRDRKDKQANIIAEAAKVERDKKNAIKNGKKDKIGFDKSKAPNAGIVGGYTSKAEFNTDVYSKDDNYYDMVDKFKDPKNHKLGFFGGVGGGSFNGAGIIKKAAGGLIPGNGTTDSVHAKLMPGEYVLNRQSVKDIGINNLQKANAGGSKGAASSESSSKWIEETAKLSQALNSFASPANSLAGAFNNFGSNVDKLTEALDKFPTSVEHNHNINGQIVLNGAEVFANMEPRMKDMMERYVANAIDSALERQFPDSPKKPKADNVI